MGDGGTGGTGRAGGGQDLKLILHSTRRLEAWIDPGRCRLIDRGWLPFRTPARAADSSRVCPDAAQGLAQMAVSGWKAAQSNQNESIAVAGASRVPASGPAVARPNWSQLLPVWRSVTCRRERGR